MEPALQRTFYWSPRILCLLVSGFISLFALDVFEGSHGPWQTLVAFIMHMVPTALLFGLLALCWRWEWIGAVVFPGLGILYLATSWGRLHWSAYAVIAGPLMLLGILFGAAWLARNSREDGKERIT